MVKSQLSFPYIIRQCDFDVVASESNQTNFGYSVAGAGSILALGYFGGSMLSGNGDLGDYFYLSRQYLSDESNNPYDDSTVTIDQTGALLNSFASSQLACTVSLSSTYPAVKCYVPIVDAVSSDVSRWRSVHAFALPKFSTCEPDVSTSIVSPLEITPQSMCFAVSSSVWQSAIAFTGMTLNGTRFFATYFVGGTSPSFKCSSGCTDDGELHTSSDLSFGDAIALYNDVLVVGAPGDTHNRGAVFVYIAVGMPDSTGYGAHRRWQQVTRLLDVPPINTVHFGAGLSLGPALLAIAAPGDYVTPGTVTVFAYVRNGNVSVDLSGVCKVARTNQAWDSDFGLAMAQRDGGDGWTVVAVGSPDENLVFLLWVGDDGSCRVCFPRNFQQYTQTTEIFLRKTRLAKDMQNRIIYFHSLSDAADRTGIRRATPLE